VIVLQPTWCSSPPAGDGSCTPCGMALSLSLSSVECRHITIKCDVPATTVITQRFCCAACTRTWQQPLRCARLQCAQACQDILSSPRLKPRAVISARRRRQHHRERRMWSSTTHTLEVAFQSSPRLPSLSVILARAATINRRRPGYLAPLVLADMRHQRHDGGTFLSKQAVF